jgi:hypothetical protein
MVKGDSKRINVRLRTPVRYALEELMERWGLGMTAALERAIVEAHGAAGKDLERRVNQRGAVRELHDDVNHLIGKLREEEEPKVEYDKDMDWGA